MLLGAGVARKPMAFRPPLCKHNTRTRVGFAGRPKFGGTRPPSCEEEGVASALALRDVRGRHLIRGARQTKAACPLDTAGNDVVFSPGCVMGAWHRGREGALASIEPAEPVPVDELHSRSGLPAATLTATLALLELMGLARQMGGMYCVRLREAGSPYKVD